MKIYFSAVIVATALLVASMADAYGIKQTYCRERPYGGVICETY